MRHLSGLLLLAALCCMSAVVQGCHGDSDPSSTEAALINGEQVPGAFPATVIIEDLCTAAKVGPNHLLLAAHCIVELSPGDTIRVGHEDTSSQDGIAAYRAVTIAGVAREPNHERICGADHCEYISDPKAIDSPDVAVILTREPLDFIARTAAIDLDKVHPGDEVVIAGSGCEEMVGASIDTRQRRIKVGRTRAIEASQAFHEESAFLDFPGGRQENIDRLRSSYFLTPGPTLEPDAAGLCPGDSGGPVYRAGAGDVIVGVNATYTFRGTAIPVTNGHTRLDHASRYRVGQWLTSLGVRTVHSCDTRSCGVVDREPTVSPLSEDQYPSPRDAGSRDAGPSRGYDAGTVRPWDAGVE